MNTMTASTGRDDALRAKSTDSPTQDKMPRRRRTGEQGGMAWVACQTFNEMLLNDNRAVDVFKDAETNHRDQEKSLPRCLFVR